MFFNIKLRCIDVVISLHNSKFGGGCVDCIYHFDLEMKDTIDASWSTSYLGLHLEFDSKGRLNFFFYDIRDDFFFPFSTFPLYAVAIHKHLPGADLEGGVRGVRPP